jgi:hypothetical protein
MLWVDHVLPPSIVPTMAALPLMDDWPTAAQTEVVGQETPPSGEKSIPGGTLCGNQS